MTALCLVRKKNRRIFRYSYKFFLPDARNLCQNRFIIFSGVMAIRLFVGRQIGVLGFALCAMRNPLGRFTLGNLQRGGGSALNFFIAAFCGGFLGFGDAGSFKNREVKDRLGHG